MKHASKSGLFEELCALQHIAGECVEHLSTLVDEGLVTEAGVNDLMQDTQDLVCGSRSAIQNLRTYRSMRWSALSTRSTSNSGNVVAFPARVTGR
ncbi:hypothetical protein ACQ4M4_23650 [Leptolyngbya sp. AN02str]|uniref:hypothetical protein n=1 Tax=Leptolyngbya sp. AN02str TaxID=3423363 RepID=UPI003D314163